MKGGRGEWESGRSADRKGNRCEIFGDTMIKGMWSIHILLYPVGVI
jgi:hypothetical protein